MSTMVRPTLSRPHPGVGHPRVGHGGHARRRAFTLIELLIVGALIALFAGLAIFGAQQAYLNNQRKAVIGESRQVATALDFAYGDIGFFPLLCFLDDSLDSLTIQSQQEFGNATELFDNLQILMVPTDAKLTGIRANWKGPYFSPSQSRSQVSSGGRSGSKQMRVPTNGTYGPSFAWPADSYGTPYVVYQLNIALTGPPEGTLFFANHTTPVDGVANLTSDPSRRGNYVNAVVSYGRNRVPGGSETPLTLNAAENFRLFKPDATIPNIDGPNPLDYLLPIEFNLSRAGMWSEVHSSQGGSYASNNDGTVTAVGITDPASDDIVFTF